MNEKYALSVNEAGEYTGIGRNTLRRLINDNKIPVVRIGNKILIRRTALEDFMRVNEGKDIKDVERTIAVQ